MTEASLAWRDVVAKDPADLGPSNDAVKTDNETVTYCQQETDDDYELRNSPHEHSGQDVPDVEDAP